MADEDDLFGNSDVLDILTGFNEVGNFLQNSRLLGELGFVSRNSSSCQCFSRVDVNGKNVLRGFANPETVIIQDGIAAVGDKVDKTISLFLNLRVPITVIQ